MPELHHLGVRKGREEGELQSYSSFNGQSFNSSPNLVFLLIVFLLLLGQDHLCNSAIQFSLLFIIAFHPVHSDLQ